MIKKLVLVAVICVSLFSSDSKYLKQKDYSNNDMRIFIGLDTSFSYLRSSNSLDQTMEGYGLYIGLPIYKDYELIIKRKINLTNNNIIKENSLIVNIPLMSRSSRQAYVGVILGEGEVTWDNNDIARLNLNKKVVKDSFYGLQLGKRFKYTRNYYLRAEGVAMKYNYDTPSTQTNIDDIYTLGFNLGFEYRF